MRIGAFAAVWLALAASACSTVEEPVPKPNLLSEYVRSTDVENDRFPSGGGSGEDRMANLASRYSIDQLKSRLLTPFPCTGPDSGGFPRTTLFRTGCDITLPVTSELRRLGASTDKVIGRAILVKHSDGKLELITLFLSPDRVIDRKGVSYGSLDEFVQGNDILDPDDVIYAPRDITGDPGEGDVAILYGSVGVVWQPWVFGGLGLVLLAGLLIIVLRRSRRPEEQSEQAPSES
ncbi:hypothetical protein [Amycolatopsis sp. NPDC051071]|uniref:hypothetical protein n=1 Tax=Amycolatopsis sp. NPDC051071 TaxID=3154637 RepID=UPI0034163912